MWVNPCFSGTYSLSRHDRLMLHEQTRLNPCFSGTYSLSGYKIKFKNSNDKVLILVLVEHTL